MFKFLKGNHLVTSWSVSLVVIAGMLFSATSTLAAQVKVADVIELFITLGVIDPSKVVQARALAASLGNMTIEGSLTSPSSQKTTSTVQFSRDLDIGSTGSDVKLLQQILKVNATGTFDNNTKLALAAFQKSSGINPPAGYFGPKTRAVFNAISAQIVSLVNSTSAATTTTVAKALDYVSYFQNTVSTQTGGSYVPNSYYYQSLNNNSNTGVDYSYIDQYDVYVGGSTNTSGNSNNSTTNNTSVVSSSNSSTTAPTYSNDEINSLGNSLFGSSSVNSGFLTNSLNTGAGDSYGSSYNSGSYTNGSSSAGLVAGSVSTTSTTTKWKFVESKGDDQMFSFGGKVTKVLPCLSFMGSPFGGAAAASAASGLWYVEYEDYKIYDRNVIRSTTTVATSTATTSSNNAFSTLTSSTTSTSTGAFSNLISTSSIAGGITLTPVSTTSTTTEQKRNGSKNNMMTNLLPPKKGSLWMGKSVPLSFGCYTCVISGKFGCLLFGPRALYWTSNSGLSVGL